MANYTTAVCKWRIHWGVRYCHVDARKWRIERTVAGGKEGVDLEINKRCIIGKSHACPEDTVLFFIIAHLSSCCSPSSSLSIDGIAKGGRV
jgi:hypothetical protein